METWKKQREQCRDESENYEQQELKQLMALPTVDIYGMTPILHAVLNDDVVCLGLLFDYQQCVNESFNFPYVVPSEQLTLIQFAACFDCLAALKFLVQRGISIESGANEAGSCLLLACRHGCDRISEYCLNINAHIDSTNNLLQTSLMIACKYGNICCMQQLINSNCNIFAQDKQGDTALHWCTRTGHINCLSLLLEHNSTSVFLDSVNESHQTALMLAASNGYRDCVFALLNAGANFHMKSCTGRNAIMYAAAFDHYILMEEMLSFQPT
jgi:ankyrin repeat protein